MHFLCQLYRHSMPKLFIYKMRETIVHGMEKEQEKRDIMCAMGECLQNWLADLHSDVLRPRCGVPSDCRCHQAVPGLSWWYSSYYYDSGDFRSGRHSLHCHHRSAIKMARWKDSRMPKILYKMQVLSSKQNKINNKSGCLNMYLICYKDHYREGNYAEQTIDIVKREDKNPYERYSTPDQK